jgi:hypothetical protein
MALRTPARPAWVEEVNAFGRALGSPAALVRLDEDSLLEAALDAAAGPRDFDGGDAAWREPFAVFLRALESEAELNLVGRLLARNEIVRSLRNRLQIVATLRCHPEIASETLADPVLVTGTGRSGTSLMHELLAEDPAHRILRTWEALHPCPPPERATYESDARIAAAHREYATFWNLVTPEYATMHENGGAVPQEDSVIVMPTFLSDHFMGVYDVPSYAAHLARADMTSVLSFHRRVLQVLQWRTPGQWVLKWPGFLARLADFFAAYPDAHVVLTHRDPLKVLPSMTSLMATLRRQRSDAVDVEAVVQTAVRGTALVLDRVMRQRADGRLPEERIIDVRYADLVTDPWGTIRTVYGRLGRELTDEALARMRAFLGAKPKDRGGAHAYAFADTGLDRDETRARFAGYMARYDVPEEA